MSQFGITVGALVPYVPMPTKIRIRVLPPIDLGLPPSAAADAAAIDTAYEKVRGAMQTALDDLVRQGGFGPRARLAAS